MSEPDIVVTHTDDETSSTNASSYTFSSKSFGAADSDRIMIAVYGHRNSSAVAVDSVTIGGVTATPISERTFGSNILGFYGAAVPTGTSGDVVVTLASTVLRAGMSLYAVTGTTLDGIFDGAWDTEDTSDSFADLDVSCPAGCAIIGAGFTTLSGSPNTWTWTGLTEDFDSGDIETSTIMGTAHDEFASAQDPITTIAATADGTINAGAAGVIVLAKPSQIISTFLEFEGATANESEYTFSSMDFGAAAADRQIVAFVSARSASGSETISSVTIGGVTATEIEQQTSGNNKSGLYIANVPTGTSGDVVVTYSATQLRSACALYRLTGLSSATPHDSVSGSSETVDVDAPANGVIICGAGGTSLLTSDDMTGVSPSHDIQAVEFLKTVSGQKNTISSATGETVGVTAAERITPPWRHRGRPVLLRRRIRSIRWGDAILGPLGGPAG